jgi:hypothetical protein
MSQLKFLRNYFLSIDIGATVLNIAPPFTIEFTIIRKNLGSSNVCEVRLYNLSEKNRNALRYDISNYSQVRKFTLNAGYGDNLPIVFTGNIKQAWSYREGVDFITTIQSFDAGNGYINAKILGDCTIAANTSMLNLYKKLLNYIPDVTIGKIGDSFVKDQKTGQFYTTTRSRTYTGDAIQVLRQLVGGAFFIDNGKSYILADNEYIDGQTNTINSQSGLLNTPLRELNIVSFDILFDPYLIIGQKINLDSSTFPALNSTNVNAKGNVNGPYKIQSITHRGVISPAVCGDAITTVEFFTGVEPLSRATFS